MTVQELIVELQKIEDKNRKVTVYNSDKCKFGNIQEITEFQLEDEFGNTTQSSEVMIVLPYMSDEL
jgi:hypothetical protein